MRVYDRLYIDGGWAAPRDAGTLDVISPVTENVVGRVPLASEADVDAAVGAARRAFDQGPWPWTSRADRAAILRRIADAVTARGDEFAALLATEAGLPVSGSASIAGSVARLTYYADLIESLPQEELRPGRARDALVRAEPVGVVAAILPWNSPLGIGFMKLAPALAAGCTIIVKTAPEAPLTWFLLAELLEDVGLPPGVVNVLCADRAQSEALVRHPLVDKVSFTGSTATGRRVAEICASQLKRCSLELGGKSAAIVLDDVDMSSALAPLLRATTSNNGEACILQSRILVPQSRMDEVVSTLADAVSALRLGDPHEPETQIGPMISKAHRERVEGYIRAGHDDGASLVVGGRRPARPERGWFLEPTIFTEVHPDMRIAREEIFGPVLSVLPYDGGDEQALEMANDSAYGLSGTVWSADQDRALSIARRVRSGNFGINVFGMDVAAPFGGMKASGIGREMGPEGLAEYIEPKAIHLPDDWSPGETA
jgi:betaine-aldehyde dehydrogenase